jgi:hypothetical protein
MAGEDEGAAIHVGYDNEGIFSRKTSSCRLTRYPRRKRRSNIIGTMPAAMP